MTRTITVQLPTQKHPHRAAWMTNLGRRLHPQEVTDAWYAAECPPGFNPPVNLRTRLRWRLACLLRGAG